MPWTRELAQLPTPTMAMLIALGSWRLIRPLPPAAARARNVRSSQHKIRKLVEAYWRAHMARRKPQIFRGKAECYRRIEILQRFHLPVDQPSVLPKAVVRLRPVHGWVRPTRLSHLTASSSHGPLRARPPGTGARSEQRRGRLVGTGRKRSTSCRNQVEISANLNLERGRDLPAPIILTCGAEPRESRAPSPHFIVIQRVFTLVEAVS